MAIRATDAGVSDLIEGVDSSTTFTPFIAVANALVDEVCLDSGYAEARLTLIETWLAAHFYSVMIPQATQEKAGSVAQTLDIKTDLQLQSSRWGQTALILDTAGNLAALSKSMEMGRPTPTVSLTSLATNPNTSTRDALIDD